MMEGGRGGEYLKEKKKNQRKAKIPEYRDMDKSWFLCKKVKPREKEGLIEGKSLKKWELEMKKILSMGKSERTK